MTFSPIIAIILPIIATLLGGWMVWRSQNSVRPWLSFSGGVLLGLVYFDLLPESFELAAEAKLASLVIGASALAAILLFHILDKLLDYHGHEGHEHDCHNQHHHANTIARVAGMGFHAFLDGLAIGGGFAADARLGILVTFALSVHKLSDGMSIVSLMKYRHGQNKQLVALSLGAIVLLPLLGLVLGSSLQPSTTMMAIFLGGLAGFFTHLSLSELLPEAHEGGRYRFGLVLTVIGIACIGFSSYFSGI